MSGGRNWTPLNPDGTFWLDNIEEGPFSLEVVHHAYRPVTVPTLVAGTEGLEVVLVRPLPRIRLEVTAEASGAPIPIVAIDWAWSGSGPSRFVPVSPCWHAKGGVIEVVVPENTRTAWISAEGCDPVQLTADMLGDGFSHRVALPRSE